jgi:hypothetical protein
VKNRLDLFIINFKFFLGYLHILYHIVNFGCPYSEFFKQTALHLLYFFELCNHILVLAGYL